MESSNSENELRRIEQEIAACETGAYGDAPLWLYLLGWADWKTEQRPIAEPQETRCKWQDQ